MESGDDAEIFVKSDLPGEAEAEKTTCSADVNTVLTNCAAEDVYSVGWKETVGRSIDDC